MKKAAAVFICFLMFPFAAVSAETGQPGLSWGERMQALSSALKELLMDSSSAERFESPVNRNRIQANLKALSQLAHEVEAGAMASQAPDADPSLAFFSGFLNENASRAALAFQKGSFPYARHLVQGTISSCIGCHTRHGQGPQFDLEIEKTGHLSPLERAELLTALRNFGPALKEYQKIVSDTDFASVHPQEWKKAVRQALVLSVRVKEDPGGAKKIVASALANSKAPALLKETLTAWERDLKKWKEEPRADSSTLSDAEKLLGEADRSRNYPADHSSDVLYLRATTVLHDYLERHPKDGDTARALLLTGTAYEALEGLGLWSLPELYYKSCIRMSPGTDVAKSCYQSYEKSVYQSYTGSAGTSLPSEIKSELKALRRESYKGIL